MKNVTAVETALKQEHNVKALPEVVIEWNMNRYIGAVPDNTPTEDEEAFDPDLFPIDHIIKPNRPTKGINKARVGSATIGDDYMVEGPTPNGRFYLADPKDHYKYWTSPFASDPSTAALTGCKPQVVYDEAVDVNKLIFTFENTWASPATFSIQTTTSATPTEGDWTEKASQATVGSTWKGKGQLVLWWNGSTWVTTGRVDNADKTPKTTSIRGVRIVVTALEGGYKVTPDGSNVQSTYAKYVNGTLTTFNTNGKDARFDLIEIAACLEVDLSPHVIETSDNFDLGDTDNLYPIGTITTNDASINLSNLYFDGSEWVPGLFSADNTDSPYHKYIDRNAKVNGRFIYYNEAGTAIGSVQQFKMYTDLWAGQEEETVQLSMYDHSHFLNEQIPRAAMWENLTVPEIVWRILDAEGFVDYHIDQDADRVTEHVIPVYWLDGEQTAWEALNDLARASQSAIYIDSSGVLQVKTRDFALSAADAPVWTFTSVEDGTQLPNIIKCEKTTEYEPNHFKVLYQRTNWSKETRGLPALQMVWEPEGVEVLRSNQLTRTLGTSDTYFYIDSKDVRFWPYEGLVNIDGELIRYKGKQFVYFTGNGTGRQTKVITSMDEYRSRNDDTPILYRNQNHFTGGLKITERGEWNSEEKSHPVDAAGYSVRHIVNTNHRTDVAGFKHLKKESKVRLNTPKRFKDYKDLLVATRGLATDTFYWHYGTMFRFNRGRAQQRGGMVIHNSGTSEDGYYIEFCLSKSLSGKERKNRNELIVYSKVGGKLHRIGGNGAPLPIGENIWYEIDVSFQDLGADHKLIVHFNGKKVFDENIAGAKKQPPNGKFGMFARGRTSMDFEYLYAIRKDYNPLPDDFSFMDKVERAYVGRLWEREWVWHEPKKKPRKRRKNTKQKRRWNERYFDDFGPYVHEVREYQVKFDPVPVLHSRLYVTNDWTSAVLEYSGTPFGAEFVIANTARINSVLGGDDALSNPGTDSTINQVITVLGRCLVLGEESDVVAKNDDQILRRGKIETEISSQWLQSKSMARDISEWMKDHFSYGNEQLSVEVFGNPLVEVGDVVHVTYPSKHIDWDCFVIGVDNSFSNGIATALTLRRRVA